MKTKSIQERIDENFRNDLKKIGVERIKNGLEDDNLPIKELTRMTLNTDNWKNVREELTTKPRRIE